MSERIYDHAFVKNEDTPLDDVCQWENCGKREMYHEWTVDAEEANPGSVPVGEGFNAAIEKLKADHVAALAAAEAELDALKKQIDQADSAAESAVNINLRSLRETEAELAAARETLGQMASAFHDENAKLREDRDSWRRTAEKLEGENERLSAPVSDADKKAVTKWADKNNKHEATFEEGMNALIAARKDAKG